MALGLTHDDPLPEVSRETLLTYYRYLAANLKFPFFTSYLGEIRPVLQQEGDRPDHQVGPSRRGRVR